MLPGAVPLDLAVIGVVNGEISRVELAFTAKFALTPEMSPEPAQTELAPEKVSVVFGLVEPPKAIVMVPLLVRFPPMGKTRSVVLLPPERPSVAPESTVRLLRVLAAAGTRE